MIFFFYLTRFPVASQFRGRFYDVSISCSGCPENKRKHICIKIMSAKRWVAARWFYWPLPFPFCSEKSSGMFPDCRMRVRRSTSDSDVAFLIASRMRCISAGDAVETISQRKREKRQTNHLTSIWYLIRMRLAYPLNLVHHRQHHCAVPFSPSLQFLSKFLFLFCSWIIRQQPLAPSGEFYGNPIVAISRIYSQSLKKNHRFYRFARYFWGLLECNIFSVIWLRYDGIRQQGQCFQFCELQ